MALINCPECNQEVSDTASACPKCGYLLKETSSEKIQKSIRSNSKNIKIIGAVIIVAICAILGINSYTTSPHGQDEKLIKEIIDEIKDDTGIYETLTIEKCYLYTLDSSMETGTGYDALKDYDNETWCCILYDRKDTVEGSTSSPGTLYFYKYNDSFHGTRGTTKADVAGAALRYAQELVKAYPEADEIFNFKDITAKANKWIK